MIRIVSWLKYRDTYRIVISGIVPPLMQCAFMILFKLWWWVVEVWWIALIVRTPKSEVSTNDICKTMLGLRNSVRSKKIAYNFYTVNFAFFSCSFDLMCLLTSYALAAEMFTSHAHTSHQASWSNFDRANPPLKIRPRSSSMTRGMILILSPNLDARIVHNNYAHNNAHYYEYYS